MEFRTTILPHRDRLYRLALSIMPSPSEAEDIVQEVMLRAWERREEWNEIKNMQAWLMEMTKNKALDRRKKTVYELHDETENGLSTELFSTESTFDAQESLAIVQQLITALAPPLDELIRLRDIEGLSYREIAQQLKLSEDQVRVYLHRARQKIKAQYQHIQNYGLQRS